MIKFVQVTDSHLFAEPEKRLAGVDTQKSYVEVIRQIREQHPDCRFLLHAGDLAQTPVASVYRWFFELMAEIGISCYCLPGNHDDPVLMRHVLGCAPVYFQDCLDVEGWRLIMLSSMQYGSPNGRLNRAELDRLRHRLEGAHDRHVLVILHHHPVPVHSAWMDAMMLENHEDFMDCIEKYSHVKAILFGHVHQAMDRCQQGVRFLSTPATCFQFKPRSQSFQLDSLPAGYRWFNLHPDGQIETKVEYLSMGQEIRQHDLPSD